MRTAGFGWKFAACAGGALALLAGACSSGGEPRARVDVRSSTTVSEATGNDARDDVVATTAVPSRGKPQSTVTVTTTGAVTVETAAAPAATVAPPTAPPSPTAPPPEPTNPTPTTQGPKPYDPSKPIDLSGTPGVTPAEQARAEQLIRDTLRDTKKYASPSAAYADGYRSIGDASTGDEHYVKWAYSDDGHILDSKRPESLVYERKNGTQFLAAAMYSLPPGSSFADVPNVGGPLTQWHVHNDLCLRDDPGDPLAKVVSSITGINGKCPPGSSKLGAAPMLHVWVVPNPCGPFAALEGVGAGQIPPGQTRLCDTAHGG